jgi:hypothetical protein
MLRDKADGTNGMGRRDEPKLDELHRLLRRLEYMEVDKSSEPAQTAASDSGSQGPGYVGALRGAPTIESPQTQRPGPEEPDILNFPARSPDRPSSSSASSVIIGATTAAVVSSIVVVGLLLWVQGKDGGSGAKEAERQRLNFVTPIDRGDKPLDRSRSVIESAVPVDPRDEPPPADTQSLLQRADLYIRNGRPAEAREQLEQAAKLGSGVAALTLGAMYDPARVAQFGNLGVQADPTLARAWYERAKDLGVVEANDRLSELARK